MLFEKSLVELAAIEGNWETGDWVGSVRGDYNVRTASRIMRRIDGMTRMGRLRSGGGLAADFFPFPLTQQQQETDPWSEIVEPSQFCFSDFFFTRWVGEVWDRISRNDSEL